MNLLEEIGGTRSDRSGCSEAIGSEVSEAFGIGASKRDDVP